MIYLIMVLSCLQLVLTSSSMAANKSLLDEAELVAQQVTAGDESKIEFLIRNADELIESAAATGSVELIREICKYSPASLELRDSRGMTPLHVAAMLGVLSSVEEILKCDEELIFLQDNQGNTAAHYASDYGREAIIKEFAKVSSEVFHIRNHAGLTPNRWFVKLRKSISDWIWLIQVMGTSG